MLSNPNIRIRMTVSTCPDGEAFCQSMEPEDPSDAEMEEARGREASVWRMG